MYDHEIFMIEMCMIEICDWDDWNMCDWNMYDHEICMIEECSVTGDRIHQEHAPGMSCGKLVDDLAMVQGNAFVHK